VNFNNEDDGMCLTSPASIRSTTDPRRTASDLLERSDAELIAEVGARLAIPRADPADSFVLHAPLELTARAALLPFVRPSHRERARLRLLTLADGFEGYGRPVDPPVPSALPSPEAAASRLAAAIDRGELDDVDAAAHHLGRHATPLELQRLLAPVVIDRLSAAAHAPIFLAHLPRVAPRGELTGELLRGLARELARYPDWRLHWIEDGGPWQTAGPDELFDAVASTPRIHEPANTFIFPLMSHVDVHGIAPDLLRGVTGEPLDREPAKALLRAAAWSMLLEPDDHAPYGWSHCLTMPQAALAIAGQLADPSVALAVAATYVVGFRSALASAPLLPVFPSEDPRVGAEEMFDHGSAVAAAAVWHAPEHALDAIVTELATRAATQHDAHLVKYTLACFDAAADDPSHRRLFLAAAASLTGYWAAIDNPDDPLRDREDEI
jgi:hypothetical protein